MVMPTSKFYFFLNFTNPETGHLKCNPLFYQDETILKTSLKFICNFWSNPANEKKADWKK